MLNKIYRSFKKSSGLRTSVAAVAVGLVFSGTPLLSYAAGLGKITVTSSLGQPLRAEIELSATRQELADMKVQLASPETFKQSGLDYATSLLSIKFSLDKRPNGRSIIKLTSDRPINDPFVDMLVELNWSTGRLVREYTFLLDPPEYAEKRALSLESARATSASGGQPSVSTSASAATGGSAARLPVSSNPRIDSGVRDRALARVSGGGSAGQTTTASPATGSGVGDYTVKSGDTLARIASRLRPDGISQEQMLVALLRANPGAFDGDNMNRLKANQVLLVPDKSSIESVSPSEARKIVAAQSAGWNAHRNRLAERAERSEARATEGRQADGGRITPRDSTTSPAKPAGDQLSVSTRSEASGKGRAGGGTGLQEDLIAREKALQEANERVAALTKLLDDQKALLALKDQELAELQKQAGGATASTPVSGEAQNPVETTSATGDLSTSTPSTTSSSDPATVMPPRVDSPVDSTPVEVQPSVPPPPVTPVEPAGRTDPTIIVPPPPIDEGPSFFEELLGNSTVLLGLAGLVIVLAGFFVWRRRAANREAEELELMTSTLAPLSKTSLMANSVFRNTGGQSVDTSSELSSLHTDFSQAGPGSIDTDEVDPVSEADVYMAYGRDVQAEEILLEARKKDPKRTAIVLKLLEVYGARNDLKAFETLATELYSETSGVGSDWEAVAAMGIKLDPRNVLFRPSASTSSAKAESMPQSLTESGQLSERVKATLGEMSNMTKQVDTGGSGSLSVPKVSSVETADDFANLDFGLESNAIPKVPQKSSAAVAMSNSEVNALDFDLETSEVHAPVPQPKADVRKPAEKQPVTVAPKAEPKNREQDFEAEIVRTAPAGISAAQQPPKQEVKVEQPQRADSASVAKSLSDKPATDTNVGGFVQSQTPDVEFDVSLTESTFLDRVEPEMQPFDLASIDLDLQLPELEIPTAKASPVPSSGEKPKDIAPEKAQATNPDAAVRQIETLLVPEHSQQTQLETLLVPESRAQETVVSPGALKNHTDTVVNPLLESALELDNSALEESVTKLELAKAYQEMGDLEGARELLQEIIKEGDVAQREAAQSLLAQIGK